MPAKFYDKNGNEVQSTLMITPTMLDFNIYTEPQETKDYIVMSY
jgi:hypothetical protein